MGITSDRKGIYFKNGTNKNKSIWTQGISSESISKEY
jgi:hypothetical protein